MIKASILCLLTLLTVSCSSENEGDDAVQDLEVIPAMGNAKAVYNQAYQENYEADKIPDILKEATNSYVLVDPFQENVTENIAAIKANGNEVGAYISVGTGENYRDDFKSMQPFLVKKQWGQWPNEYFVSSTTTGVIDLMKARIDKIAAWGCDWVEFDNMDWVFDDDFRAEYKFKVTQAEGMAYFQALCDYVHAKGMKCMAKNTVEGADNFDGVLYESYSDDKNWWDVSGAKSFLKAGKLVIINHYDEPNCGKVYSDYRKIYNDDLSFICEDSQLKKYVHFNQ